MEWVKEHAEKLLETPIPSEAYMVKMDELRFWLAS